MMSILLAMGLGISSILISQIKTLKGMENSLKAFCAADTGVEQVLYWDKICRNKNNPVSCNFLLPGKCIDTIDCDDGVSVDIITDSLGPAIYIMDFDNGALNIFSTGFYKETRRTIEVTRE